MKSIAFTLLAACSAPVLVLCPAARAAVGFPMYVNIVNSGIDKITSAGVVSLFATLPANSSPYGLAFDGSGNLYVADSAADQISKITPEAK